MLIKWFFSANQEMQLLEANRSFLLYILGGIRLTITRNAWTVESL